MLVTFGFGPAFIHAATGEFRINVGKLLSDVLGKGKIALPVAGIEPVIENPACAPWFVAMGEVEIVIAALFEIRIPAFIIGITGRLHGRVNVDRVGKIRFALIVEQRCQVAAAAKPAFAGDQHASIHMHGRHAGIVQVCDQRNSRGPEFSI